MISRSVDGAFIAGSRWRWRGTEGVVAVTVTVKLVAAMGDGEQETGEPSMVT